MNYKLEKFWNNLFTASSKLISTMNYKLEKFWNYLKISLDFVATRMNYKLEKFWNISTFYAWCVRRNEL